MLRYLRPALLATLALLPFGCSGSTGNTTGGIAVAGATCSTEGMQATARDGCNLCRCEGGSWQCTATECVAGCTDGDRRDDGCNVCACGDGKWSCTRLTCGGPDQGGTCQDGERRPSGDGCNTCACSGGEWGCTLLACEAQCIDGDTTNDGCNSCTCSGGTWQCTDVACPPPECIEGDTRSGTCEQCDCIEGSWQCTGTPCAAPVCPDPLPPDTNVLCTAVVVYARDSDTGTCCEYGDACSAPAGWAQFSTLGACELGGGCTPGDTRDAGDGCNTCSCDATGAWSCTEIGCAVCDPGTTRREIDGCSVCTCEGAGQWTCLGGACSGPIACGGFAGDPCTDDEFCAYQPGQLCGAADASSVCQPRPATCLAQLSPVCGCDGVTYDNACLAAQAGVGVLEPMPCAVTAASLP